MKLAYKVSTQLESALAELFGSSLLSHVSMADIGLDDLSAIWLQHHLQQHYEFYIQPSALLENLSINALAVQVANLQSTPRQTSKHAAGCDAAKNLQDIQKKLITILEGNLAGYVHFPVFELLSYQMASLPQYDLHVWLLTSACQANLANCKLKRTWSTKTLAMQLSCNGCRHPWG